MVVNSSKILSHLTDIFNVSLPWVFFPFFLPATLSQLIFLGIPLSVELICLTLVAFTSSTVFCIRFLKLFLLWLLFAGGLGVIQLLLFTIVCFLKIIFSKCLVCPGLFGELFFIALSSDFISSTTSTITQNLAFFYFNWDNMLVVFVMPSGHIGFASWGRTAFISNLINTKSRIFFGLYHYIKKRYWNHP